MRLSKDLIGKSVVTISDGSIVGKVKDIYLSSDVSRLAGIHLGKEGVLRRKSLIIPADSVEVFGIDVILIDNADAMTDSKQMGDSAEWVRLDKLTGRSINTPGGTKVATVDDVLLDEDGSVLAIALGKVFVEGPIKENRVLYRSAVIDYGHADNTITIDLNQAESLEKPQVAAEPSLDSSEISELADLMDSDPLE